MKKTSLVLLFLQILVISVSWQYLPLEVPLLYSRPWGEDQLIRPVGLFIIPCLSFLIWIINFAFLKFTPKQEKLLQQILTSTSALFNLLGLITLIQIIRLAT
jgi:hypothetical protein